MRLKLFSVLSAILLALASACSDEPKVDNEEVKNEDIDVPFVPVELSAQMQAVADKSNDFSLSFIHAFDENTNQDNYAISPFSTNVNLMMLANAANTTSREEILNVLGYEADEMNVANEYIRYLSKEMVAFDKKADLKIANSVWVSNGYSVVPDFAKTMTEYFDADIKEAKADLIAGLVNDWASEKTEGKISRIVNPNDEIKWMFANALYFQAKWLTPFKETGNITFINDSGQKISVPAMKAEQTTLRYDGDGYKVYFLRYGNSAFKFGIILPDEGKNLKQAFADISNKGWKDVMSKLVSKGYDLTMPKFEVSTCGDIKPVMKSLGIGNIFDKGRADLSNFTSNRAHVDIMNQGATIKVDENGTIASAVTVSGEWYTANESEPLTINRPFGFVVIEECSHAILVAGKVTKLF